MYFLITFTVCDTSVLEEKIISAKRKPVFCFIEEDETAHYRPNCLASIVLSVYLTRFIALDEKGEFIEQRFNPWNSNYFHFLFIIFKLE